MLKSKFNSGQSLLEVVIAFAIVAIILVALVSASSVAVRNSTFASNKSIANKYVNEGLEAVRSIRDKDWAVIYGVADSAQKVRGLNYSGNQWNFITPPPDYDIPQTGFTRKVTLKVNSPSSVGILVVVSWNQGGQIVSSQASIDFTNWHN